jgi:hypothetical protein
MDGDSTEFEILANAKMFDLLSNKLYSDPIRAIIRELCCNAIDAHLDIGNTNPISVYLPTIEDPSLIIQDFGIGMTHEDVITVYKTYGKSTKSSSNKLIGALGLGGKTPLAYTSQFTLTTARDGTKNYYVIFRNEAGIPEVTLINSEESDETGTSVELTIKNSDIRDFYNAAYITFIFFDQLPNIKRGRKEFYNLHYYRSCDDKEKLYHSLHKKLKTSDRFNISNKSTAEDELLYTIVDTYSTNYGIIMGQVFYTVESEKLYETNLFGSLTKDIFKYPLTNEYSYKKICKVDPGVVSFQPSREALSYSVNTKNFISKLFLKDFEDDSNKISSYKNDQDFLNNIEEINFDFFDILLKKDEDALTNNLKNLVKKYKDAVSYFFTQSKLDKIFCLYSDSRSEKYKLQEINFESKEKALAEKLQLDLFKKIFTNKYNAILEIDDPEHYVKILEKWLEKNSTKLFINLSSFTGKYLENFDKNHVIVSNSFSQYFKDNISLERFVLSDFINDYNSNNTTVSIKTKRAQTQRNTEGRCWNKLTNKEITMKQLSTILAGEEAVYELFEGHYDYKGYYFEPNFTSIGPKNSSLENVENKFWEDRKISVSNPRYEILLPRNYLYVDYNFFKKNELWNLKNLYFYKDYYLKELITVFTKIRDDIKNPIVWHNRFFSKNKNDELLNIGVRKYGKAYANTVFGKDYAALINERTHKKTDFAELKEIISYYVHHKFLVRGKHLIPQYNSLAIKLIEYSKQLLEEIKVVEANNEPKDFYKLISDKYFMLRFVTSPQNLPTKELERVVDYIASIDGLKPLKND